jgi:NAD(P)-dependent dehydrogenase (short-subunit alcohol dehydrogenase family)
VAKLRAAGVDAFGVPLDVTDDAAVQLIEQRAGRLDALINNAGAAGGWPELCSEGLTTQVASSRRSLLRLPAVHKLAYTRSGRSACEHEFSVQQPRARRTLRVKAATDVSAPPREAADR